MSLHVAFGQIHISPKTKAKKKARVFRTSFAYWAVKKDQYGSLELLPGLEEEME